MEHKRHGMEGTKPYEAWHAMKQRCDNPNHRFYPQYGGRGISFEPRWARFLEFYGDMGFPMPGWTLDRIDNELGYSKENCRWVQMKVQCNNRRSNVFIEWRGERKTIAQWAESVCIERKTLEYRIRSGWTAERALSTPSLIKRK